MADTSNVPLWVPVLTASITFVGGVVSGQLNEFFRSKRERQTQALLRGQTQLDKRNDFQRETLLEMQDAAVATCERMFFFVNNRHPQYPLSEELKLQFEDASEAQQRFLWRWGVLRSRLWEPRLQELAALFGAASVSPLKLHSDDRTNEEIIQEIMDRLNDLNAAVGTQLKTING